MDDVADVREVRFNDVGIHMVRFVRVNDLTVAAICSCNVTAVSSTKDNCIIVLRRKEHL